MSTRSGKRLLVLAVALSGVTNVIVDELKKRGWEVEVVDVPYPYWCKPWALLATLSLPLRSWKRRYGLYLQKIYKSPAVFRWRSRFCASLVESREGRPDVVLQMSALFAPYRTEMSVDSTRSEYFLFVDYTMALSRKYDPWLPREKDLAEWLSLEAEVYRRASRVFTASGNSRRSLMSDYGISGDQVEVVKYGPISVAASPAHKTYDQKTILFVGFDFERKGGRVLLDAFRTVRHQKPEARLLVAGPRLSLNVDGVTFLGPVQDRARSAALFQEASLFVLPSLAEPFGLVFLEAMAHGLPCVGTHVDAIPEIIDDGETGRLVPPNETDPLARAILDMLNSKADLERMGKAAREKVAREFSWAKLVSELDEAFSRGAALRHNHNRRTGT